MLNNILCADDCCLFSEAGRILYVRGVCSVLSQFLGWELLWPKVTSSINADDCVKELADILDCEIEKSPLFIWGFFP